ncbi:hypothetical protein BGZ80_010909 [Entomortierella chlamydospora]|uniref:Uncharacterized protein n=1 Tax=Entomortierella chlamydospora TaxID=101097 RepID=A0A9P6MUM6_9FUNG|nr:hypothetical protein BGZ79_011064 [Entomortierella chlamydospora]KAG0013710.1 hypothetical protein BGZ80_010909 [Entomortierella chlamydospora]
MSQYSAIPTDNLDHCGISCGPGYQCFIYPGGTACQPYQVPDTYPVSDPNATLANPPGWYIAPSYPSIRYAGYLGNQTQGANCTTIPLPKGQLYQSIVSYIQTWDLGRIGSNMDSMYLSTLVQYRGNCAEGFFCQPSTPVNASASFNTAAPFVLGQLAGTCQVLKAESQPCQSSNMCMGWHVSSQRTFDNDQFRCKISSEASTNSTISGVCTNMYAGKGTVSVGDSGYIQGTARTYLLTIMLLFVLIILFLWYRRQKQRQRQLANGYYYDTPNDNSNMRQGGVYRPPDENDNGELPAYGQHRRDERIIGPAAEEIGMYSFSNQVTEPGSNIVRPLQTYPYPAGHPTLGAPPPQQPLPAGALYPPPSSNPPPLTAQEAEAAALTAAAAAAAATVSTPALARSNDGGILPPTYEISSNAPSNAENTTLAAATAAGGEKQGHLNEPLETLSPPSSPVQYKEKPSSSSSSSVRNGARDADQASTSSGSGSGSPFKD